MDKFQMCSGIVCAAYHAADGRNVDIEHFLIKETELIAGLVKGNKWGKSDYLLHIIFWTLRDRDCSKILKIMPNDNISLLKEAIAVAKQQKYPNTDEAKKISEERKYVSLNPTLPVHQKYNNNIIRFSALINIKVADKWNTCVKELNKWDNVINGRESEIQISDTKEKETPKTVPAPQPEKTVIAQPTEKPIETKTDNSELWTMEELTDKLGYKKTKILSHAKTMCERKHPEIKEMFVVSRKHRKHLLFKSEYFEDFKQLLKRRTKTIKPEKKEIQSAPDSILWDTDKLAKELGLKDANSFYCKKTLFLKKHPEAKETVNSWFVKNEHKSGYSFKSEHFEDLNQLMNFRKTVFTDATYVDNEELWPVSLLATKLGFKSLSSFYQKRKTFLKAHPECTEQLNGFFRSKNGKRNFLFKAKHFDELQKMISFRTITESDAVAIENNKLWTTEQLAHKLGLKNKGGFFGKRTRLLNQHPEYRALLQSWFVKNNEYFQSEHFEELKQLFAANASPAPKKAKQISDMVSIEGLKTYLAKLTKMCDFAIKEKDAAQASYDDLKQKADIEKEKIESASKQAEQIQHLIETVNNLLNEYDQAEDDLHAAQEKFNKKRMQINDFLQQSVDIPEK